MTSPKFDLIVIMQTIVKKIKFILLFTLVAVVIGLIFSLIQEKRYTSTSLFIVKSPMSMDRNHIFKRGDFYQATEFFASENDIDHIVTIANSDAVLRTLVHDFDLKNAYRVKDEDVATKRLKKRMKFKRKETKGIEIKISDADPKRAADLAKAATSKIEAMYKESFMQYQRGMILVMQEKMQELDKSLSEVENSIAELRAKYGIYDEMLPLRGDVMVNRSGGNPQKAEGMERLQRFTSQKDQLVEDRDSYVSLINEYSVETNTNHLKLFYQVEEPGVSYSPSSPIIPLVLAICFLAGLIFSSFLVLLQSYYQRATNG